MSCRKPYVGHPKCKTAYSATNPWFEVLTGFLNVCCLGFAWSCWRSLFRMSRNGLPLTVDALQFLQITLVPTFMSIYLLSPLSLRHGMWLDVISTTSGYLAENVAIGAYAITPLAAVRSVAATLEGRQGLPKWEVWAYVATFGFVNVFTIPCVAVEIRGRLKEVPQKELELWSNIRLGGHFLVGIICNITIMCYVRTIKDPRSLKLLKSYKINACAGLCVFLLLLTYFIFIFINHQTAEGFVGHTCVSDDDLRQLDIRFLVNNFAYGTMIAVFAWMAPSIAHRCGVKWKKEGTGEETWSIDMNEAAMSGAVVLALGLSLYVPTLVPFSEMEIFMTTLMFGTCCGATLYFSKSNRLTHECLCDLSAASFIRRCDTWVGTLQFHLPGVKAIMIDCFLYVPLPFSHSTWPSEFSSTWPSELKVLAWTDKLNDFIMYMTKEVRFTVLMFLLLVYCGWAMLSFILRLFPMKSYYLTEAYVTTSWFLYLPLVMISTRLILDGVKCRDGNLLLNDAPCDEQSEHLTIHILFMSCLIWFVSLASLHFTGIGRLTFESLIAENPTVSVRNSFLRMMTILVAGSKLGALGSIALPIFEIVILALATAQQFYDPLLIGHARNSAIHAGTLAYILALFVSVLLHFFLKLSIPVLFIACIGCPPITFVLGYHVAYKRFANIDNEVQEQVRISRDIDFTLPELPPRLLGICFHAAPFKKFIRDNLDITQKPKTLAKLFQTNVRIISQHTVSALSFAGRRFSSSRSIGSPVTPCAIVPEPSPRTSLMPPSKQPLEPPRGVLLELEPLPNSLLESPPNQQEDQLPNLLVSPRKLLLQSPHKQQEEQLPNLQVSPRKLLLESPRELPQEPLETHDSCTSLALTHLASAISMDCGRRVLLRAPEFVTTMPHWLLSAHRSKAIKCVRAMAEMEALH